MLDTQSVVFGGSPESKETFNQNIDYLNSIQLASSQIDSSPNFGASPEFEIPGQQVSLEQQQIDATSYAESNASSINQMRPYDLSEIERYDSEALKLFVASHTDSIIAYRNDSLKHVNEPVKIGSQDDYALAA